MMAALPTTDLSEGRALSGGKSPAEGGPLPEKEAAETPISENIQPAVDGKDGFEGKPKTEPPGGWRSRLGSFDEAANPEEGLRTAQPARILWRSVILLVIIVAVPSVLCNLLLPTLATMEDILPHLVVVVSCFIGLAWLFLFVYFVGLYLRSWRTEPRFATVLAVLLLDALRNLFESAYFGFAYSGGIHLFSERLMRLLWAPQVVLISRLLALATALVISWLVLERGFENLQLREQRSRLLEQRNRELTALQQLAALVSSTLDTPSVLNSVCRETVETLSFQSALLCLVDEGTGTIRGAAGYGVPLSLIQETVRKLDGGDILADIVRTGATEVLTGWDDRLHQATFERYCHADQIRVFAPIQDAQGTLGVIDVMLKGTSPAPDEHRLALLHSFLRYASTAIRNARLHERVVLDRERLNTLTGTLEDKNKQLESFVYMISHDLKAPLVSIQGFLTLLVEDLGSEMGEDGRYYVERIRANTGHLQGLIQQLLELSRIGRVEGEKRWLELDEMVEEIERTVRPRLSSGVIELSVERPLPRIYGEPTQLRQLLFNLIDNAIKYMGASEKRRINIQGLRMEQGVELVISDTGVGIPEAMQERVFQMFHRVSTPGISIEGNGVGLAIVRKIAETQGGRAWVESAGEGRGAAFHIWLPQTILPREERDELESTDNSAS